MVASDGERYCVFRRASQWYALPAENVLEVAPVPDLIPIPCSPDVLAGLCHLRNEFIPVLRLPSLAGESEADESGEKQLLVVQGSQGPWAVLVDRVVGLESLDVSLGQETHTGDDWTAAVQGSATMSNRLIRILDARRVYRLAESMLQHQWKRSLAGARLEPTLRTDHDAVLTTSH